MVEWVTVSFSAALLVAVGIIIILACANHSLRLERDKIAIERDEAKHNWRCVHADLRVTRDEYAMLKTRANDDYLRVKRLTEQLDAYKERDISEAFASRD